MLSGSKRRCLLMENGKGEELLKGTGLKMGL